MIRRKFSPPRPRQQMDSSLAIVNIVLLLIFFFLTTGSLSNSTTVTVTLPETSELPLDLLPKPLLTIAVDGTLSLNGEQIERGTLAEALVDDPRLHILADKEANASDLFALLAEEALVAVEVRLVSVHRKEEVQ
ncbi:biopolymer transporter ExbD [Nereida sp. MMG025]|uniref:ExbD/TolR family protein n=1 Tax=Nereida sp. MMG025 TaxID=2909981 RepID=UPI001F2BDA02|nr:biopolymer transporter ExbD [Nereida sp. MMG025]MCF6445755.1 biopolymer transporter ExbD [Nereida sp. MMG025]